MAKVEVPPKKEKKKRKPSRAEVPAAKSDEPARQEDVQMADQDAGQPPEPLSATLPGFANPIATLVDGQASAEQLRQYQEQV